MITGVRVVADRLICSVIHRCVRCDRSACDCRINQIIVNCINHVDGMSCRHVCEGIAARIRRCDINTVHRYAYQMITGVRVVADRLICSVIHRCVRCDRSAAYRRVDYVRINRIDRIDRMVRMNIRKCIAARVCRGDINAVHRYAYQMVVRIRGIVNGCICSLKDS